MTLNSTLKNNINKFVVDINTKNHLTLFSKQPISNLLILY